MGKVVIRGAAVRQRAVDMLRNGYSIEQAAAATGFGTNYVRQLGAKEGLRFRKSKIRKDLIVKLYEEGLEPRQIAEQIGAKSLTTIYTVLHANGVEYRETRLQLEVRKYRENGLCCAEIADALGRNTRQVRQVAIDIGMPFTEEEKKRSIEIGKRKCKEIQYGKESERIEKQKAYITENHPNWTYISGWISGDGLVELKCNCCGTIVKRSAVSVRHKNVRCDVCYGEKIKAQKIQRETEKETNRRIRVQKQSEKYWRNFWKEEYKLPDVKKCRYCGAVHVGKTQFCSEECRRKHANRQHDRRIKRVLNKDMSINLEKLFNRDNGICWICGGKCDYDDYHFDENKHFVVGNNYPSIDHVFPLSKGGNHTWENVRLAHHYCNTLKRDKVVG